MWTTIVSIPTSLSLEEPKKTIQAALDLTLDRDTVLVDDGIYATGGIGVNASPLLSRVGIAKAVTVMSVNGPELTIIEGRGGSVRTPRAALIQKYPWTSLNGFSKIKTRPKFMDCRWMYYAEGLSDTPNGWRRYAKLLAMRNSDDPKEIESLDRRMCRGWSIGAEEFRKTVSEDFLEKEGAARLEKQGLKNFNEVRWETGP